MVFCFNDLLNELVPFFTSIEAAKIDKIWIQKKNHYNFCCHFTIFDDICSLNLNMACFLPQKVALPVTGFTYFDTHIIN